MTTSAESPQSLSTEPHPLPQRTRPGRVSSYDIRARLVGPERREWDALHQESEVMYQRRLEITKHLNRLRNLAWCRERYARIRGRSVQHG